jgi:hypothetical protein
MNGKKRIRNGMILGRKKKEEIIKTGIIVKT